MKKIKKSSELLWLMGTIFVAFGVALCSKADLGVSMIAAPAFIVQEFLAQYVDFLSVGMTEYVIQAIILLIMCIAVKKFSWKFIFAFVVAVVYGYVLDFFLWALSFVTIDTTLLRWITLLIGDMFVAIGVASFFRTYMPLQVYELFVREVSVAYNKSITKIKLWFDLSLFSLSVILAFSLFGDVLSFDWASIYRASFHSIGLGTVVTTIINSPLIATAGKIIDMAFDNSPRFLRLEKFFTT